MEVHRDAGKRHQVDQEVDQARRPRKSRSPHPGVSLLRPDPQAQTGWRSRWRDPETGKRKARSLTAEEAKNGDTRKAACMTLYRELQARKHAIRAGASPHRDADRLLTDAIASYFKGEGSALAAETQYDYRLALDHFERWAEQEGIRTVRQLTRGQLAGFRVYASKIKKRIRLKGGKRGEMTDGGKASAHTANKAIRTVAIVLNSLRRHEVIRLSSDDISDQLKRLKAPQHLKDFLRPHEIAKLLDACRQHDARTFKETRKEHAAGKKTKKGATAKWPAITEYVEFLLYTGVRIDESLRVTGSMVHPQTSEILMPAEMCKWQLARSVDLTVSKTLMGRAKAMRANDGLLFPHLTEGKILTAFRRMARLYGAPRTSPHVLRRCCGTYLANAPVFGPWKAAKQLGHRNIATAEKHYLGVIRLRADCRSLEEAMGLP